MCVCVGGRQVPGLCCVRCIHFARHSLAGRYMYVELLDAPGFGPGPVVEPISTSPPRGR